MQYFGDVLQGALRRRGIPYFNENRQLLDLWQEAVGAQIAAETRPENLKRGTLFIKATNPGWIQQLQYMKQEIILKINNLSGKELVSNIYFSIGEIRKPSDKGAQSYDPPTNAYPLSSKERDMIEKSTGIIADSELKELLGRLMAKDVIRRRLLASQKKDS